MTKEELEKETGSTVYNTEELTQKFSVNGFMAPFVMVTDKITGEKGTLEFQHNPRFYFGYRKD